MANYERTIKSAVWNERQFESLTNNQKLFYFLLHCGDETSDCGVFALTIKRIKNHLDVDHETAKQLVRDFVEMGLLEYDMETEEALPTDYFRHNPNRGIFYEGYQKDLKKIQSSWLLNRLKEVAKGYQVSIAFLSALSEFVDLDPNDYDIRESKETLASVKTVQKRGRDKIAAARKQRPTTKAATRGVDVEVDDEELGLMYGEEDNDFGM